MSFAFPTALLLALLAVPIAALYILKVRLRRLPVSTSLFWKQIYEEKPPRSIFQHLRHLLSLLAQLLILMLLVFAVADPFLAWQPLQARRIVLVIDHSASMQTTENAVTRLQLAKQRAHDLVSSLRDHDEVAIVLAGKTPEVLVGMTGHLPTLRRRLDQITATDNPTHLSNAIELGKQLIGEHPHGQVIVYSDGCVDDDALQELKLETETGTAAEIAAEKQASQQPGSVPTGSAQAKSAQAKSVQAKSGQAKSVPVDWQVVATPANNVGITALQARRSLSDPLGYEILVAVWNASPTPVRCRLEITLDELPVDVLPLELAADERWQRSLEKTSIEGGILQATLTQLQATEDHQGDQQVNRLQADDSAHAILPARKIQNVLIVTPGNLFLRKVFETNPLVSLEVRQTIPEQWPDDTLMVLHGDIPSVLPSGNVLVIDPKNDCDLWTVGESLANPLITDQQEQSPLMTHIRLDNVLVPEAREIAFRSPVNVLAGTVSGHAIYAELRRDSGRCLVLNVNLDQSDLAFRTAFPILVANALNWFGRQGDELRPSLATGSLLQIELADLDARGPLDALRLVAPSGQASVVTGGKGSVVIGPLDQVGVWRLQDSDGVDDLRLIAVNLANQRETDLRPPEPIVSVESSPRSGGGWFHRPIWFYIVALLCVLVSAEWFLYQRRLIS